MTHKHHKWSTIISVIFINAGCTITAQNTAPSIDIADPIQNQSESKIPKYSNEFLSQSNLLYDNVPDIEKCLTGTLKKSVKDGVLNTVNKIRALHRLAPVVYDDQYDDEVMKGSLIIAASGHLTHHPEPSDKCHSPEGANGAKTSNILGGAISPHLRFQSPDDDIIGWITDVGNASGQNVGHRRWLLDPFLKKIAFGRVASVLANGDSTDGSMIRVVWNDQHKNQSPRSENNFVAYPFMDYPQEYFDENAILSFTAIDDQLNRHKNKADYSRANLEVVDETGNFVQTHDVKGDNEGYGVPNVLQFRLGAVQPKMKYMVNIRNVLINGQSKSYSYWFRVV